MRAVAIMNLGLASRILIRIACGWLALLILFATPVQATVLYQTGFESKEGFSTNLDLSGQNGWIGQTAGGNGIINGLFPGKGQQAYVGFSPPTNGDTQVFVYQPLNVNVSTAQFAVSMSIEDSFNTNWDDFYWSAYNQQGAELFTLDFDNYEQRLYYHLGGATNRVFSGLSFSNSTIYQLTMTLDFVGNRWSALLNDKIVATNKPLSTTGAALNLGDFDAAWVFFDPAAPGDNFMVFDDYQVTATVPAPQLVSLGILNGAPIMRVAGVADNRFAVEGSTDLSAWLPLKTNITTGGSFDFVDATATNFLRRFYRARWLP